MTTRLIPSNVVQKIPTNEINGRVIIQPNTWYTCPTGKKAIVKGKVQCTGRGAAATADFVAAGIVMFTWDKSTVNDALRNPLLTPLILSTFEGGQPALFEVQLSAGETIVTQQNSGTNAEFNLFATVQETPA